MWLSRGLGVLLGALAAATSLAAQSAPQTKSAEPRFSISISVEPDLAKVGSEIWVKVTLTNKAKATTFADLTYDAKDKITLDVYSQYVAERDFAVYMYDAGGNLAPLTYYGRQVIKGEGPPLAGSLFPLTLRPQDSFKREIELSKLYDLSHPGKYTVQVERGDDSNGAVAKSNIVMLTLKPKS